jgi:3-deoxy-manno-octulosonate cytidylyltransferase (CMP-KDO synthetase)
MNACVLVVIPLRKASTRLKNKIFLDIEGLSLSQRSVGRALEIFKGDDRVRVVAAVDDLSTEKHLQEIFPDLQVIITDSEIPSGTDRVSIAVGEMVKRLKNKKFMVRGVINLQGDIPFVGADGLRNLVDYFLDATDDQLSHISMLTLAKAWPKEQDYSDPSAVKVISSRNGFALYFSRYAIPYSKVNFAETIKKNGVLVGDLHIGVYGYTPNILARICSHTPVELERAEGLEQLRAMWLEIPILVLKTEELLGESYRGIDTAQDLKWARSFAKTAKALAKGASRKTAKSIKTKLRTSKKR